MAIVLNTNNNINGSYLLDKYRNNILDGKIQNIVNSKISYPTNYYSKVDDSSTYDGNLDSVVQIVGAQGAYRFSINKNVPVFFQGDISMQMTDEEFGNEVDGEIQAVISPDVIIPQIDDFINVYVGTINTPDPHQKAKDYFLFRINDVQTAYLNGSTFYQITLVLATETIEDLDKQTIVENEYLEVNGEPTILPKDSFMLVTSADGIITTLEKLYNTSFYKPVLSQYVCSPIEMSNMTIMQSVSNQSNNYRIIDWVVNWKNYKVFRDNKYTESTGCNDSVYEMQYHPLNVPVTELVNFPTKCYTIHFVPEIFSEMYDVPYNLYQTLFVHKERLQEYVDGGFIHYDILDFVNDTNEPKDEFVKQVIHKYIHDSKNLLNFLANKPNVNVLHNLTNFILTVSVIQIIESLVSNEIITNKQ